MASGSKTANAGLTKWESADPVLMEDFNSMLDAIDLAIGERTRICLLRDVTPEQETSTIQIDLSDLDFSDYFAVAISFDMTPDYIARLDTTYSTFSCGVGGAAAFLFPFKDAARTVQAFTTMASSGNNSSMKLSESFSAFTGMYVVGTDTIGTDARIRIWGVR